MKAYVICSTVITDRWKYRNSTQEEKMRLAYLKFVHILLDLRKCS